MAGHRSGNRFGIVGRIVGGIWRFIQGIQSIILTLLFYTVLFVVVGSLLLILGSARPPKVPDGAALVIAPAGLLVEQMTEIDGFQELLTGGSTGEVLVSDVVTAIDRAAKDKRITTLVLRLDALDIPPFYASKAYQLADAVERFKSTGKSVIALGNGYSQAGYLIASHADEIWLHPFGAVFFSGYQSGGPYFRSLLDKLLVTVHTFRVGEFKSAIEPFTRDDMSDAARAANMEFLGDLWAEYTSHIETQRGFETGTVQRFADHPASAIREAGGDIALAAKNVGLVDRLMAADEWRDALVEKVGRDPASKDFKQIDMYGYLTATTGEGAGRAGDNTIVVIVARGNIVDGEAPRGTIGGDTLGRLIRKARDSKATKAIVLRVDSPGGSVFASEVIRRELVAARAAGIPVVASMGSIAASGGYWISASADEIWAERTTITGSIGVFAIFPTLEKAADRVGVHIDVAGTTALAGGSFLAPLNPQVADIIQQSVDKTYDRFVDLVATSRGLSEDHVRQIAEGRVWSGIDALELGLVDNLGGLDDAIKAAAKLANVDRFNLDFLEKERSPLDLFFSELRKTVSVFMGLDTRIKTSSAGAEIVRDIVRDLGPLLQLNDPNNVYVICQACEVN